MGSCVRFVTNSSSSSISPAIDDEIRTSCSSTPDREKIETDFFDNPYAYHFNIDKNPEEKKRKRYRGMVLKMRCKPRGAN